MRRTGLVALVCAAVLATTPGAAPAAEGDATLQRYARDTWASFVAMTDPRSGLPADVLEGDGGRSVQTSTTNIGAYLWSAVAAERLGVISSKELVRRTDRTLTTLERMERHARAASSTTGTTTATGQSSRVGRRPASRWTRSSPPSTTAGWRPACGSSS